MKSECRSPRVIGPRSLKRPKPSIFAPNLPTFLLPVLAFLAPLFLRSRFKKSLRRASKTRINRLARPLAASDGQRKGNWLRAQWSYLCQKTSPARCLSPFRGSRFAPRTGVARLPPDRQQKSREFEQPYGRFIARTGLLESGTSVRADHALPN